MAQQASMAHWQSIIKILTNSLNVLKSNYVRTELYHWLPLLFETRLISHSFASRLQVPPFLICKLFTQVFSFINVQLFNRYMQHMYYHSSFMYVKTSAMNR